MDDIDILIDLKKFIYDCTLPLFQMELRHPMQFCNFVLMLAVKQPMHLPLAEQHHHSLAGALVHQDEAAVAVHVAPMSNG